MQVYKCVISNDEMFSGIYPITETQNGMMLKVTGKLISRTEDIDPSLLGANESAEGGEEGTESSTVSGVNIVINHNLQQTSFDKKSYSLYIKKYLNDIKKKLMESDPDRVKDFMANAAECVKMITGNIKNWMFYTGESMDADGMVGLLDYSEDGVTPYMLFFKDGLEKIKY